MRNDLLVKVTLKKNKNVDELFFDYINKKGEYIGYIIINSQGKIAWNIINALYQENLLNTIIYINGNNNSMNLDYVDNQRDIRRWNNANLFIFNSGLHLNYIKESNYSSKERKVYKKKK